MFRLDWVKDVMKENKRIEMNETYKAHGVQHKLHTIVKDIIEEHGYVKNEPLTPLHACYIDDDMIKNKDDFMLIMLTAKKDISLWRILIEFLIIAGYEQ